jgi:hypothetical protein
MMEGLPAFISKMYYLGRINVNIIVNVPSMAAYYHNPGKAVNPQNEKKYSYFKTIPGGGTPEFDRTLFFW